MKVLLVSYDNDSYIHTFPLGIAYIAAVLRDCKFDVEIWHQDVHHYSDEALKIKLDKEKYDFIGIGMVAGYYQYKKLLSLSKAINSSNNRPIYLLGGHGPTANPEYFLKKTYADVVVMGESETSIVDLVRSVAEKKSYKDVSGIAYRNNDEVIINKPRDLIKDIDSIPFPAYDLFPMNYYRLRRRPHSSDSDFCASILSGRGCPYKCTFCYRMDKGFRPRSTDSIIEEIKLLKKDYGITYIEFADELLMSSVERTENVCTEIIKANLNIKWSCSGRLNYAKKDLLMLMKKAGCVFINYGIEALDDQVLKKMNKVLTVKQIIAGIEATLMAGISPGYNVIWGNLGDNIETLNKGVDFLIKYDDCAQLRTIRPVTPYPGSPLFDTAVNKGLLKNIDDFYEKKHLNSDLLTVNFTELSDDDFHMALCDANKKLLNNYYNKKKKSMIKKTEDLYIKKNVEFRGYRHT
jgi:anaerobic magnesium-protoporphyrin IX monomethyl ester cyclase